MPGWVEQNKASDITSSYENCVDHCVQFSKASSAHQIYGKKQDILFARCFINNHTPETDPSDNLLLLLEVQP